MEYCDSSLQLPEINYEIRNQVQSLRSPNAKLKSWTNKWMVRWIQDQDITIAMRDLKTYVRKDREIEIEEQTIGEINSLPEQDALWYIRNLRDKPRQVRATGKNQMDISGVIITMDTLDRHSMKALIDSGCTGSCIIVFCMLRDGVTSHICFVTSDFEYSYLENRSTPCLRNLILIYPTYKLDADKVLRQNERF